MVIDQAPKLMRRTKLPIVKAKIGPKISILIADEKIFELIPVKKEVKADVSGLYIVGVRGNPRSSGDPAPEEEGIFQKAPRQKQITDQKASRRIPAMCRFSGREAFFLFSVFCFKIRNGVRRIPSTGRNPMNLLTGRVQTDSSPPRAARSYPGE